MKLNLNKNIQTYRKQRGMTQEQLAEAMGVTVGAVSKWENGLSNPDLELIMELADFFEISVDVLLGYQLSIGSMKKAAEYIRKLDKEKRYDEAHTESLKALQKYPNSFAVVYASGSMEFTRGLEQKNNEALKMAIQLLEKADALIDQNEDERISSIDIQTKIAHAYVYLKQYEEAVSRLKQVNPCGMNDDVIGGIYVSMERYEDAEEYLSQAFESALMKLLNICVSLCNCYSSTKREQKSIEVAMWMKDALTALAAGGKECYLSRFITYIDISMAIAYLMQSKTEEARGYIKSAMEQERTFDQAKNYCMDIRFMKPTGHVLCDDARMGDAFFVNILEQCKEEPKLYEQFNAIYQELKEEDTFWTQEI